jgi:hypothetical protein
MSVLRDIEFRSCAQRAYGKNWQWRLAIAKGIHLRTVQSWALKATERVPEPIYAHVRSMRNLIEHEGVDEQIEHVVDRLRKLGLNDHVIAAQLHAFGDRLSPPGLAPAGAPKPKNRSVPDSA